MTDDVKAPEATTTESPAQHDNDPMLVEMEKAEKEIAAPTEEKPAEAAREDKPEPAKPSPMIPKPRFDEVLSERDAYRGQAEYLKGVLDTQRELIGSLKGEKSAPEGGKPAAPAPNDYAGIIAKAESDKLEAARRYEDGEITLVEFKRAEIDADRSIRDADYKKTAIEVEGAKNKATEIVAANNKQVVIETEALTIQDQHPYVDAIDALPPRIRDGIWAEITEEAVKNLSEQGINVRDGSTQSHLALIKEKAALTDKYGPQYTGKKIDSQSARQPSETAAQRAAKFDLANKQPPEAPRGSVGGPPELTEKDIMNMSQEQLADLMAKNPRAVEKAAGLTTR